MDDLSEAQKQVIENLRRSAREQTAVKPAAFNNSGTGQLKVPGYGLPLNYWTSVDESMERVVRNADYFCCGVAGFAAQRLTVKEIAMLRFVNVVTDKPQWDTKVFQDEIVSRWASEVSQETLMTEAAFEWCIREVRDKVKEYKQMGYVKVLDNDTTSVKSDTLIEESTRLKLIEAIEPLIASSDKDWHPHSNGQVLNLVHPSLCPLVYGKSRVLPSGQVGMDDCVSYVGRGEIIPKSQLHGVGHKVRWRSDMELMTGPHWSTNFQWLPCEVRFSGTSGTDVRITSYINNLHPTRHRNLYRIIESIISSSIEPWNEVLVQHSSYCRAVPRITTDGPEIREMTSMPGWVEELYSNAVSEDEWTKYLDLAREFLNLPNHPSWGETTATNEELRRRYEVILAQPKNSYELADLMNEKHGLLREIIHPDPGVNRAYERWKSSNSTDPDDEVLELEQDFREEGLQVIVKLASIELTPENPEYPGGNWHVEGMLNEHIVATSIYYYDVGNTTESSIRFRQRAELDELSLRYEQDDHGPLCTVFGTKSMRGEPAIQEIGKITTPQGRLLAFSNVLHHRVEPFGLLDRTRPGHRRFLVLWLVDPHFRVTSTANVPPQQYDWWADEQREVAAGAAVTVEGKDEVTSPSATTTTTTTTTTTATSDATTNKTTTADDDLVTNSLIRQDEANEIRLRLMSERTSWAYGKDVGRTFGTYNLCEH